jgi:glycine/D-amino acid oxidase-like deaminating enzyme
MDKRAMSTKEFPFWWEDAPRPQLAQAPLPQHVDVAIIGAGFSGLCTALTLARAGVSVAIFEAGEIGCGASTLNGGMVGPSFHKLGVEGLKAKFGTDQAIAILKESMNFVGFLENFLKSENIDADFKRVGRFRGAVKPEHLDSLARELDILKETINVKGEIIAKADQAAETGSKLFHGGVSYYQDSFLHPAKYHNGLVKKVLAAGVQIFAHTPVIHFEKQGLDYTVTTPRGSVKANKIAVCTNGYTGKVTQELRRRILPIRSAMIATEELSPELINKLMPKGKACGDSRRLVAYYRPSPDGKRILFGSRASALKDYPQTNVRNLKASMVEVYPELADVGISHVWSGLVAYTFDHVPHIGQADFGRSNGVYYAMGYCGSGVARASYFGTKLGMKILDLPQSETAFDHLNFETHPLYTGNPWFMPYIMQWHRLADKLGF